jgi:hypothetical protein
VPATDNGNKNKVRYRTTTGIFYETMLNKPDFTFEFEDYGTGTNVGILYKKGMGAPCCLRCGRLYPDVGDLPKRHPSSFHSHLVANVMGPVMIFYL